jgi:L-2-hydroxyglutarate oxidase LhgO
MDGVEIAVIGAGVVGLAVARVLAQSGREVVVLEKEPGIGRHTSSRNSEVIHSGIYYRPGSNKARLCVAGRLALYRYCEENGIAHQRLGKILVATSEDEIPTLEKLRTQAEQNGVNDLEWLDEAELRRREPALTAVRGLHSPSTGILNSDEYMRALRRDAEAAGAQFALATTLLHGRVTKQGIVLSAGGNNASTLLASTVVNAAGPWAPGVARSIEGMPDTAIPQACFAKGHYASLRGRAPFSTLIYPVPVPGALGVHYTLDLAGQARFGPDITWVDAVDYGFDESRVAAFYPIIRRYYPTLADGDLSPGYTGVRPKIVPAGVPDADFLIQGPSLHGVPGLINLFGIESPGLTASLALAEEVLSLVEATIG